MILYPSNWVFNAGVIGLLLTREKTGEKIEDDLLPNGACKISCDYFSPVKVLTRPISKAVINLVNALVSDEDLEKWLDNKENRSKYKKFHTELGDFGYKFVRAGNILFSSERPYQNLVQFPEWQSYEYAELVENIPSLISVSSGDMCNLCSQYHILVINPKSKLQIRLTKLQSSHLKNLGPSIGEFPNGFWNLNESLSLCFLCSFLLLHHHLAFTKLSDGSEMFINTPSFQITYYLNKFAKQVLGVLSPKEMRDKRDILAVSVIEYATKIKATLGVWAGMNIEIITKYEKQIDFYSLPYDIVQLISDRKIAGLLSQIGEFSVLNHVLNKDFSWLLEVGYRLFRISLKPYSALKTTEKNFVNNILKLDHNRKNPARVAEKIFHLYGLIEEKKKRREKYEYLSTART